MKFTLFKNSRAVKPDKVMTLEQFLFAIKSGQWKFAVLKLRAKKNSSHYKTIKGNLPAVTISGEFKVRDKNLPIEKKIRAHSGLICLDIDKKDNPKMRTKDLIDPDCVAQFLSAGGEGLKIIYYCKKVKTEPEHRRIYDAAVARLVKRGIKIKVDPIVKSISSLQYVSYDEEIYENIDSNLCLKPLSPIKRKISKPTAEKEELLLQLDEYIDALGKRDITKNYEDWLNVLFGIGYSIGESGRNAVHALSKNYKEYSTLECDEKFDSCLEMGQVDNPITIATVFQIINSHLPKIEAKRLGKKYNKAHAVGVGVDEDSEHADLAGMVRYKLFLFKKLIDKDTSSIHELVPMRLNLNEFEKLLRDKGFFRFEKMFVHIVNNMVEIVDGADILRIVTEHIQQDGDYTFVYRGTEYKFSWEEIIHRWREIRGLGTTANQLHASLTHWLPNLLKDTINESFIPYRNGVVSITAKTIKLIPYEKLDLNQQIWKERILPRDFKLEKKSGMFEAFFVNVMGRGKTPKERLKSVHYQRALWYYGYMLQGSKRQSTARAWLLYDVKSGNNGRSGKTIIGTAIGKVRNVTVIDGKQVDLTNRFWLQTLKPWTDIVFIDDPSKFMSLIPFFNMISGQTSADRKGKDPIEKDLKFLIASNWFLESEGSSESGRQFVSQLDDFYTRYSKEHDDTITPLVDLHGKEFFTDWNDKDWAQFDTFCAHALQFHLKSTPPQNTIIGNSSILRFIQLHEEELFFELSLALIQNAKVSPTETSIAQQLMTSVVRENNESLKANKAGRIVREFLNAIGAKNVHISTTRIGGRVAMAYFFSGHPGKLEFGSFKERLFKKH